MAYPHPQSPAATISSLSHDDRRTIYDYIPSDCKVIAAAPARIYHSSFGASADDWASTGLRGMLVFGRNRITVYPDRPLGGGEGTSFEQNYWFRLIDVDTGKGIVWFHPIPHELDYHADKPFFHTFSGASRMFGFRFDEDHDADKFHKRVTSRVQISAPRAAKPQPQPYRAPAPPPPVPIPVPGAVAYPSPPHGGSPPPAYSLPVPVAEPLQSPGGRKPGAGAGPVSTGMIGAPSPGSFVHVAHVGLDAQGRVESSPGMDPGWTMLLEELQGFGVTEKMAAKDFNFVEGFLAGAKASLVQELNKTTAAAGPRRAPQEGAQRTRSTRRKNVPAYF
ncbi:hypothetical protein GSI_09249 [Ganoderma sinense ZZ0214-1]|uniref:Uncharacterized protein n=1 Tax=Ganoderma sinense ZZ0214-1 TaxID=1077348 RepID=A0A2G8S5Z6_9APHY|nr:hypothetical protein GSI_09249 [Ganoderma sinense ZZ0214-1]